MTIDKGKAKIRFKKKSKKMNKSRSTSRKISTNRQIYISKCSDMQAGRQAGKQADHEKPTTDIGGPLFV